MKYGQVFQQLYRAPDFDLCPELEQQTKFKDVDFILYFGIKSLENST